MIELEVKLKDGISAPAGSAAHQVQVLTQQMRALQNQMIKANALGNEKAFQKAATDYQKAGKAVKELSGESDKHIAAAKAQQQATQGAGESMGGMASAAMMAVGAYVAIAAAMAKVTQFAYANAASSALVKAQFDALGKGGAGGKEVVKMIDQLGDVLPASTEQMTGFAKSMMRAGITDIPRLKEGIKAITASSYLMDDGGKAAQSAIEDINKAARSGVGMGDFASRIEGTGIKLMDFAKRAGLSPKSFNAARDSINAIASTAPGMVKLGNLMQRALIEDGAESMKAANATWEVVTQKMKDNAAKLFVAISDTEGFKSFTIELQRIAQFFGGAEKSGQTMQISITSAFDAIFKIGTKVLEGIQLLVLNTAIAFLKFAIFVAPVVIPLIRFASVIYNAQTAGLALKGGLALLVVVLGSLAIVFAPIIIAIIALVGAFYSVLVILGAVWEGLVGLYNWAKNADWGAIFKALSPVAMIKDWIKDLDIKPWIDGGKALVEGIAKGIADGATWVKDAIVGLGGNALQWFKDKLAIKSPSRVFMQLGGYTAEGFAQGVEKGTPEAAAATGRMAEAAIGGGAIGVGAAPKALGAGGGMRVEIAPGAIVINGASSPAETANLLEESLVSIFERMALTQGVA